MRAILDTNVLIAAAIFPRSVPRRALDLVRTTGELIFTTSTFEEVQATLFRSKFDRYIAPAERVAFVATLMQSATWVDTTETIRICRDPKDDKFLDAATAGRLECLVSGDGDLLSLDPFRGIRILKPAAFLAAYAEGRR